MARVSYKAQWLEVKRELEMVKRPWYKKCWEGFIKFLAI